MVVTVSGCAAAWFAAPHPRAPKDDRGLPFAPGAFRDVIEARAGRLQIEYRDDLALATQEAGNLELYETREGLMFTAHLERGMLATWLALAIRCGQIQRCCPVGKYDALGLNAAGTPIAITHAKTCTINLLLRGIGSQPSYLGTWVRLA